jgi:RND superfamily putative drug exporter
MTRRGTDRTVGAMPDRPVWTTSTLGRLGGWAAGHRRMVVAAWVAAVLALGALAPFADSVLSGAGWEARGTQSAQARHAIDSRFPGQGTYALSVVVAGRSAQVDDPPMRAALARVEAVLRADPDVGGVREDALSRDRGTRDRHRAGRSPSVGDGRGRRPA